MNSASAMELIERRPAYDLFGPGAFPELVYRVVARGRPATVTVRGASIRCSCKRFRRRGACKHVALVKVALGPAQT